MPDEFQYDVFLSHSSKDKKIIRPLAEHLKKDGIKVWFDEWEIKPGDSIPAKIEEGLERSRVLVLCMSAHAFGSEWAQLESGTFRFRDPLNKERRFIPLRLDDAPIKGSLGQFLYINWQPADREQDYAKIIEVCRPLWKPISTTAPAKHNPSSISDMSAKRFRIAFSFAGEKRDFVAKVASILGQRFGEAAILYDKFHVPEFSRSDLAFYLPELYEKEVDLVVAVFCQDYDKKEWCGLEWNAIYGLLKARKSCEVMLTRFDRVEGKGLRGLAGYADLDNLTPEQAADLILERFALNEGKSKEYYKNASKLYQPDPTSAETLSEEMSDPPFEFSSYSAWFHHRFGLAFPGIRNEVRWIDDTPKAIDRLSRLLQPPLRFTNCKPAWWFRGTSCNSIESFRVLDDKTVLLGHMEFEIARIAAIDCGSYWNSFVYVEASAVAPSGAYPERPIAEMDERRGYRREEVCLFQNKYLSRLFFDDGAAEINGKIVSLDHSAELRIRYLSKYNIVIAGNDSSLNNRSFELEMESLLNKSLADQTAVSLLAQRVRDLPKRIMYSR